MIFPPIEIWLRIASCLVDDPKTIVALSRVCKLLHAVTDDDQLWYAVCTHVFPGYFGDLDYGAIRRATYVQSWRHDAFMPSWHRLKRWQRAIDQPDKAWESVVDIQNDAYTLHGRFVVDDDDDVSGRFRPLFQLSGMEGSFLLSLEPTQGTEWTTVRGDVRVNPKYTPAVVDWPLDDRRERQLNTNPNVLYTLQEQDAYPTAYCSRTAHVISTNTYVLSGQTNGNTRQYELQLSRIDQPEIVPLDYCMLDHILINVHARFSPDGSVLWLLGIEGNFSRAAVHYIFHIIQNKLIRVAKHCLGNETNWICGYRVRPALVMTFHYRHMYKVWSLRDGSLVATLDGGASYNGRMDAESIFPLRLERHVDGVPAWSPELDFPVRFVLDATDHLIVWTLPQVPVDPHAPVKATNVYSVDMQWRCSYALNGGVFLRCAPPDHVSVYALSDGRTMGVLPTDLVPLHDTERFSLSEVWAVGANGIKRLN